jgi:hypothetical protein
LGAISVDKNGSIESCKRVDCIRVTAVPTLGGRGAVKAKLAYHASTDTNATANGILTIRSLIFFNLYIQVILK